MIVDGFDISNGSDIYLIAEINQTITVTFRMHSKH